MRPNQLLWTGPLFFLLISEAHPQNPGSLPQTALHASDAPLFIATDGVDTGSKDATAQQEKPYPWHIAVYPALAWAPIFGSSVDFPPTPSHPIDVSGSTDLSFNAAYFGGARVEMHKWSGDVLFMWAALSASRTAPLTSLSLDFVFGDAMLGREVLPNFFVEGGFRRLAFNVDATVQSSTGSASPGYWDPLIGITYRRELGKKWRVLAHADGGGFGAGSDVDVSITGRGEWQFARHYGMLIGYGGMHLSDSTSIGQGTLHFSPTLHGPILGFGVYF